MKKFIIMLALCAVVMLPFSANAEVLMGEAYTTQIEPMEQIAQLRSQLIALIKELILTLQAQLDAMVASQGGQVEQTTTQGGITAPSTPNEPTQQMADLNIVVTDTLFPSNDLAITVSDREATCKLVVTDDKGNVYRDQDTWTKDKDGNGRQVVDLGPTAGRKFTWEVKCTKPGFEPFEQTGEVTTG